MDPVFTEDPAIVAVQVSIQGDGSDDAATREEEASVKRWEGKLLRARKHDRPQRDEFDRWRRYAAGERQKGKKEWLVDTNLIEATIEGLVPSIYARNPEIEVSPSDAVGETHYAVVRQFAKTVQTVINRLLWDAKLKRRAQRSVRSVFVSGIGVLKVTMQLDSEKDPEIERRIASLTDNLRRIDYLMREQMAQDETPEQLEAQRAELQAQIEALSEHVEVMVAKGLVIDVFPTDDVQVDDEQRELVDYEYANWIALRTWYTPERAMEQFGLTKDDLRGAKTYATKSDNTEAGDCETYTGRESDDERGGWLACWEIWDKQSTTVYTHIQGLKRWVRAPFAPKPAGRRFYPIFLLGFHWQDNRRWPLVPVQMWHKLQDEYARTRSSFAEHRRRAKPARIADKDAFSPEDAKKVNNPDLNELVLVDRVDKTVPLKNQVATLDYPQVDAGLYDTSAVRADLEQVSGLTDAGRSAVIKPKTATEANILASGGASRSSLKQDEVEDMIEDIACYVAELALQCMTLQDAQRYAGPGAVWPRLSLEQIHTLLDINVRAGTSGMPNTAQEQQTWTMLAPQIWRGITQIYDARAQNKMDLADALTKLLELTLEKFDIKVDMGELVPKMQPAQLMGAISGAAGAPQPSIAIPGDQGAPPNAGQALPADLPFSMSPAPMPLSAGMAGA